MRPFDGLVHRGVGDGDVAVATSFHPTTGSPFRMIPGCASAAVQGLGFRVWGLGFRV